MIYLLAAIGLATLVVLVWRAFGPDPASRQSDRTQVPPDDDPEFLRRLDEQRHDDSGGTGRNDRDDPNGRTDG